MAFSARAGNVLGAAACALLLGYAYYLQYHVGLEPCPLCIFQRVAFVALGGIFLIAALHHPRGRAGSKIYAVLIGLVALVGAGIAARHVWIQSQPPGSVPACGAPLDAMLEMFPVAEVVRKVLTGGGECAEISWTFLGLSMPIWTLAWFVTMGAVGAVVNWKGSVSPMAS